MAFNCEVTWFCCGSAWGPCGSTGRGACDTCDSSFRQHAWPHMSRACRNITRPDRCGRSLTRRGCGFEHRTRNRCNGLSVVTSIADCGPHTDRFCGEQSCCGSTCSEDRMIDLTAAAYSVIASLSTGKRPAAVSLP